jgi:hypothetical protein
MSRRPSGAAPRETLRLVAEVILAPADGGSEATRWLRILGDDKRGYLLVGDLEPNGAPVLEEFWFPSLEQAFGAAEAVGVPRAAWDAEIAPPNPLTGRRD